jgi:arylformamidase
MVASSRKAGANHMTKLVDLSHPWGADTPPFLGLDFPTITVTHRFAAHNTFMTRVSTAMHCGTHIDAQNHFIEGGWDIASLSLDTLYGPGVIVDVSDEVGEWGMIKPEHITSKMEVRPGDILIYYTGWSRYYFYGSSPDEIKYMLYQPGGGPELAQWIVDMKLRWTGVDTATPDHPMWNAPFRRGRPDLVAEYEQRMGVSVEETFPIKHLAVMHKVPFAAGIVHAENIGGDIETVLNRRVTIGAFPWKFKGGDACICRVVAFLED